jgi:hypothetical protein
MQFILIGFAPYNLSLDQIGSIASSRDSDLLTFRLSGEHDQSGSTRSPSETAAGGADVAMATLQPRLV